MLCRYNTFGTPLSPILEERESSGNSDSLNLTRDDVSTASKGDSNTLSEDDVLLIDTQTNKATLVEGGSSHSQESQVCFFTFIALGCLWIIIFHKRNDWNKFSNEGWSFWFSNISKYLCFILKSGNSWQRQQPRFDEFDRSPAVTSTP